MKKILFSILFVATALVACEDDVTREESPVTPEGTQGVFFPETNEIKVVLAPAEMAYTVSISRKVSNVAADVPIHASTALMECFSFPATVHFNAGQAVADYKFSVNDNMEFFKNYLVVLKVDNAYADFYNSAVAGSTTFNLNIQKADWKLYAKGTYTSVMFPAVPQDMEYSAILDQYRLPDCFQVTGMSLTFTWDGGASFTPVAPKASGQYAGMYQVPAGYYQGNTATPMFFMLAPSACKYTAATKTFNMSGDRYVPAAGGAIPGTADSFKITTMAP